MTHSDATNQSLVHTPARPVSLERWIGCHFLFTNTNVRNKLLVSKKKKPSCCFLHCKCGHNMSLHVHVDAVCPEHGGQKAAAASFLSLKAEFPVHRHSPHCQKTPPPAHPAHPPQPPFLATNNFVLVVMCCAEVACFFGSGDGGAWECSSPCAHPLFLHSV